MKTALIIPNRNYAQYLKRALESAGAQTVPFDEIIVVDGCSTDNSRSVAENSGIGLKWIVAPPKGMANGKNVGIQATSSELIVTMDADDFIEPNFLERCLTGLHPHVGVVATQLRWPDGRVQSPVPPFTPEAFETGNRLFTCSLFRKACWKEVGGFNEDRGIYEDWFFWACISILTSWEFEVIPEPLFHYCPHADSSCGQMNESVARAYWHRTIDRIRALRQSL